MQEITHHIEMYVRRRRALNATQLYRYILRRDGYLISCKVKYSEILLISIQKECN